MAVGGTGVGVEVGGIVGVGTDVDVFWTGWKGVRVGSASSVGGICGTQADSEYVKSTINRSVHFMETQLYPQAV